MRLRRWLLPAILAVLLSALALWPVTESGREWLLHKGVAVLEDLGYRLEYGAVDGNPWLGLELSDVRFVGPGMDVTTGRLRIDYFLPSLLAGELPVSIDLEGLRGAVELDGLQLPEAGPSGMPVSVILRELSVNDVALAVDGIPWSLPALSLEDVSASRRIDGVVFEARVRTDEGEAHLAGQLQLEPWLLDVEVRSADVRLARHWWSNARAGTAQGRISADANGVTADLTLTNAALTYLNLDFEEISGPVTFDRGLIQASLTARGLDGPVTADIEVNVPARRWEATARGRPELEAVAEWLAPSSVDTSDFAVRGSAETSVAASGWGRVNLTGRADGSGSLLQLPLDDIGVDFGFVSGEGASVSASASLASGPLQLSVTPSAQGRRVNLQIDSMRISDELEAAVDVTTFSSGGNLTGRGNANLLADLADRTVALNADASLDADGLQIFLNGQDDKGASIEGAAVLDDGNLEGQLSLLDLFVPGVTDPFALSLRADGPIESLPLALEIGGAGAEQPELAGTRLLHSFAGGASGVLEAGEIKDLEGQFGPVAITGSMRPTPLRFDLDYRLAPISAQGPIELSIASSEGSVSGTESDVDFRGRSSLRWLRVEELVLGPLDIGTEGAWAAESQDETGSLTFFSLPFSAENRSGGQTDSGTAGADATSRAGGNAPGDGRLSGHLDPAGVTLSLDEPPLTLSGIPLDLAGEVLYPFDAPARADVRLASESLELQVEPLPSGGHRVQAQALPGLELGPLRLRAPLQAVAEVGASLRRAQVRGKVGALSWRGELERGQDGSLDGQLVLSEGERTLEILVTENGRTVQANGSIALAPLAQPFGLPVSGFVESDLARNEGEYAGGFGVDGVVAGVPIELQLTGDEAGLLVDGALSTLGVPWRLAGRIGTGTANLSASSDLGSLHLEGGSLQGSGTVPRQLGPISLPDLNWNAAGTLADAALGIEVAGSSIVFDWSDGVSVQADVEQDLTIREIPAFLDLEASWQRGTAGRVAGELVLAGPLAGHSLALAGDTEAISVTGTLPATEASEALLGTGVFAGEVDLNATIRPLDGFDFQADASLSTGESSLTAKLARSNNGWSGRIEGPGLHAAVANGRLSLEATEARLEPYLDSSWLEPLDEFRSLLGDGQGTSLPTLDGNIDWSREDGWQGSLSLLGADRESLLAVIGANDELLLEATPNDDIEARGKLLPSLDLDVTANELAGLVDVTGRISGSPRDLLFSGDATLRGTDLGPLTVRSRTFEVEAQNDSLVISGDGTRVALDARGLSGNLALDLELAGEPHSLLAELSGSVARPGVEAIVEGPLATGSASWDGSGTAQLEVSLEPWLPSPLAAVGPARLTAAANREGNWQASGTAPLTLPGIGPVEAAVELTGIRSVYQGVGSLRSSEGRLLGLAIEGEGAAFTATADLTKTEPEALAALLPLDGRLLPRGTISYASTSGSLRVEADLTGEVAGLPIDLAFSRAGDAPLQMKGQAGGVSVLFHFTSSGFEFEVADRPGGADDRLQMNGAIVWGDEPGLTLTGSSPRGNLSGVGGYDPLNETGTLSLSVGQSLLELAAEGDSEGRVALTGRLDNDGPESIGPRFNAEFTVIAGADDVVVEHLAIATGSATGVAELALSGSAWPRLDLSGSMVVPGLSGNDSIEAEVDLTGSPAEPELLMRASGLSLRVQRGVEVWHASLDGTTTFGLDPFTDAVARSALEWSESDGFSGDASVTLRRHEEADRADSEVLYGWRAEASLEGQGGLELRFVLGPAEEQAAPPIQGRLKVGPRPWSDPQLDGVIDLSAHLESLWSGYPGRPLSLGGTIEVDGTILEPVAAGELALTGALAAQGTVRYEAAEGSLVLIGPDARVDAVLDRDGLLATTVALETLPLDDLLPAAAGTRLSAGVEIARAADGSLHGTVTGFEATRDGSRVEGTAEFGESVSASAQVDLDLSDLPLGPPLTGTVAGSIAVTAAGLDSLLNAVLRGDLEVRDAGLENGDAHLSGSLAVSGPVDDPRLRLDLAAGGRAGGNLLVDAAPASGRLSLRGDLRWGELETDLAVAATRNEIAAHGRVDLPGGHFVLSDRPFSAGASPSPGLQLSGFGRYRDWVFGFSPRGARITGEAVLGTLDERLGGTLSLETSSSRGEPWLQAVVEGLAWQDISVGDVLISAEQPGSEISLTGENVRATVRPAERISWELERLALSGDDFEAVAAGSGNGTHGRVDVTTSFTVAGEPVSLPLTIRRDADTRLAITGQAQLLGGSFDLAATLADEGDAAEAGAVGSDWSGTLSATGIEYRGTTLTFEGEIAGAAAAPTLLLSGSGEGSSFSFEAEAKLALDEQSASITLRSPLLSSPLEISAIGGASPGLQLVQREGDEAFELVYPDGLGSPPLVQGSLAVDLGELRVIVAAADAGFTPSTETSDDKTVVDTIALDSEPANPVSGVDIALQIPELKNFELYASLPAAVLTDPAGLLRTPVEFSGRGGTTGGMELDLGSLTLRLDDFGHRNEDFDLRLQGDVRIATAGGGLPSAADTPAAAGLRADLVGEIELLRSPRIGLLPALPANERLPFRARAEEGELSLESSGHLGELRMAYDTSARTAEFKAAVGFGGGTADARFAFDPSTGPSGTLRISGLPLITLDEDDPLRLSGDFEVDRKAVTGNGELRSDNGSLRGSLTLGLRRFLPARLAPNGSDTVDVEMRLGAFDLETIPMVATRLPHLDAPVSGFMRVSENNAVARLVAPDLTVAGESLPVSVDANGTIGALNVDAVVGGSPIRFRLDEQGLTAFATLDRFPLERLVEAVTGPVDVGAEVTGVARLEIPWSSGKGTMLELATELVRLERAGVVTTGNVSMIFSDGELVVHQAEFDGAGQWRASGSIRRDLLDFTLSAEEADFSPLLGLVPALTRYSVTAQGSLELAATGSVANPNITLRSPALRFGVAGSRYALEAGEVSLQDERLAVAARVSGVSPVTGQLVVAGGGNLKLLPLRLQDARFTAKGAADVPGLGEISDFSASVTSKPGVGLWLEGDGRLGEPFTVEGGLAPLDIGVQGNDLSLRLPRLLLASAQVDADIRLRWQEALLFSGALDIDAARFELGIRPRSSEPRDPNPIAERFVFEDVAIRAPGRVRINENFGSAEVTLDLLLAGSAAQTRLHGTSQVLRGTFQFSGRDFEIESGEARFDPSRGVLPVLDVSAVTSFDMTRVQPGDGSVRFVAPAEGSRFEVTLAFSGEVEPEPGANPPFRLDLTPSLSSNALIQEVREDRVTSGPRSLTEPELLSLITLGRLELNAPLAGQSGLATAVAEGAIDTAVDLLIVSELQTALSEALGVEMVEIRTTALSSIFGRSASDPFSVSLRLGGYLSDEVFASYRIGSFDDVRGLYALTNEVSLLYELGPLELDLAGRVNFEDTAIPTPDAELSATVRYAFDSLTSLETGIDLSNERQQVRFGVTLRW